MFQKLKKFPLLISFLLIFIGIIIPLTSFSINKVKEYHEEKILANKINNNQGYYAIIDIPKIGLKKELYEINDLRNNVNKNILVHKKSIFPNNIILASHSGNGSHAYFKDLFKLEVKDKVKIYYGNKIYEYEIEKIEEQNKTGELYIKEDFNERLILITCHKNNKTQVIYYSKLKSIKDI